jgi:hypothetical protein
MDCPLNIVIAGYSKETLPRQSDCLENGADPSRCGKVLVWVPPIGNVSGETDYVHSHGPHFLECFVKRSTEYDAPFFRI